MSATGGAKKILRVGALSSFGTLDPRKANDTNSSMILNEVFESPYVAPFGNEPPEPRLFEGALTPEGSANEKTQYSAVLRPGIVFSDGTPLTPEVLVKSLMSAPDFTEKASAEVRGQRVHFRLKKPNPRFDLVLTTTFCSIVLEKDGTLLGTGPFMFPEKTMLTQLQRMDPLVIVRNPRYRRPVDIDEIQFSVYEASSGGGTAMLIEALKRNEIDFTYSLTSVDAAALRGFPFTPAISTGNATGILHFNTARAPLDDAEVRRALAWALDRRKIAESTYERNPLAYIASGLLPPVMGRDPHTFSYDLTKAKATAAALGSRMPKRLSLMLIWSPRPYIPNPKRAGELIQEQLAALGVQVDLTIPRDRTEYFEQTYRGSHDMVLGGWIADTADPADFLEALLASRSIPSPSNHSATTNNVSRWSHPPMDAAISRFQSDPTEANRAEVMKILTEEAPLVPLIYGQAVAVYARHVRGFRASSLGRCSMADLQIAR